MRDDLIDQDDIGNGDRCQHGFEGPCGTCERQREKRARLALDYSMSPEKVAKMYPFPRPKNERILAISDELLKDLTEDRDPQGGEPLWTLQYQNRIPIDPEALRAAAAKLNWAAAGRAAAETIDRMMLDGVNEENTFDDDDYPLCESEPILKAIGTYARQFYIPMTEEETINGWFARIAPRVDRNPRQGPPFLVMMKSIIAAVQGIDTDDLDALIDATKKATSPNGHVPSTPMTPVRRCGCGCNSTVPASAPGPHYSPQVLDPNRKIVIKDADLSPLLGRASAPKDSLLNPKPKGFDGASNLPFDSDYD